MDLPDANSKPKVSIVVPVYNCPGYLSGAVESVRMQTRPDWELIIVDDGSDDGRTPALCDSFASDPRVKIVHTTNAGVSAARNTGIELAEGEFLAFLDADDLLHPDFLKLTTEAAEATGADIVFGGIDFYTGNFKIATTDRQSDFGVYRPVEVIEKALYQTGFDNAVWGKIYHRSLWQGMKFNESRRYEDLDIFYKLIFKASTISLIPLKLYGYRQHSESYMHVYKPERVDMLAVVDEMRDWIAENLPQLVPAAADRRFSAYFNMLILLYRNRVVNPELEQACFDVIGAQSKSSLRNPNVRLKNRIGALAAICGGRRLLKLLSHLPV